MISYLFLLGTYLTLKPLVIVDVYATVFNWLATHAELWVANEWLASKLIYKLPFCHFVPLLSHWDLLVYHAIDWADLPIFLNHLTIDRSDKRYWMLFLSGTPIQVFCIVLGGIICIYYVTFYYFSAMFRQNLLEVLSLFASVDLGIFWLPFLC